MKRPKKDFFIDNLKIIDAGSEGMSVGKYEGMIVFVPYGVPEDLLKVQILRQKKNYGEAKIIDIVMPSPYRILPKCTHFGLCGGCKWQNMDYTKQLLYKQKQVEDNFSRIGKFDYPEIQNIISSDEVFYYRNKLEYTFSDKRWLNDADMAAQTSGHLVEMRGLGFHVPGKFDKVLDIDHCYLQASPSNDIRLFIKDFCIKNDIPFYNVRTQEGLMRNMILRTNKQGEVMLIMVFKYEDPKNDVLLKEITNQFSQIKSLYKVINQKVNDSIADLKPELVYGDTVLIETMEDLKFEIGPLSFYQTNTLQACKLYSIARDFADIQSDQLVYDLYTGIGTIADFMAKRAKKVIGIEYVESAIKDAVKNAADNHITNVEFFAGDMAKVLTSDFVKKHGKPDVVITDPPRAGMHPKVIEQLLEIKAEKIVYVSCNPATQARDIDMLKFSYRVDKVQPVDMFPHTQHVENVVLLTLL